MEQILRELREFCQENKEQIKTIKEEMMKVNARLDEAEGQRLSWRRVDRRARKDTHTLMHARENP